MPGPDRARAMSRTCPTRVRLSATVMSHPARRASAAALVDRLPGLRPLLSFDIDARDTSLLGSAASAWEPRVGASHHAVFQDDTVPARGIEAVLPELLDAYPDAVLPLFAEWGCKTAAAARIAVLAGFTAVEVVDRYVPTNAVVAPRAVAAQIARRMRRLAVSHASVPDDVVVREVVAHRELPALLPLPNLVQDADLPSTTGNDAMGRRLAVCPSEAPIVARVPAALRGLTVVPFFQWRTGRPLLLTRRTVGDPWERLDLWDVAARVGLDQTAVEELTTTAVGRMSLPRAPAANDLLRALALVLAATAACAASFPGVRSRGTDAVTEACLATAVPGALRCLAPAYATPSGAAAAVPFTCSVVDGVLDMVGAGRVQPLPCVEVAS